MLKIICIGWIIGIAFMGQSFTAIHLWSAGWCIGLALILAVQCYATRYIQKPYFVAVNGLCAAFLSVLLGYQYANLQLNTRLELRETKTESVSVLVYVNKINQLSEQSIQQPIQVIDRHPQVVQWFAFQKKSTLPEMQLGQYYRIQGQLRPAHAYAVEGSFDQEQWYLQQNIMAALQVQQIQALSKAEIQHLGHTDFLHHQQAIRLRFALWIEQQRYAIRSYIQQQNLTHTGLLLALLTGDKSLLNQKIADDFQRFGMSHLLAISGPHVLIFAMLFCWGLKHLIERYAVRWYLKWPRPYILMGPFLLCVGLYCACVGFEIPALRTFLICLLTAVLLLFRQVFQPLALLVMSASILLFFDPFSILSAAFWLSYGACFILLRIYQTLAQQDQSQNQHWKQKFYFNIQLLVESQWKIFLALLPLMLIFFKQIAWISPITNLIAIPYLGLIVVPLDVLAGLSFFIFKPLAHLIFQLNDSLLGILLGLLSFLDYIFKPTLSFVAFNKWQMMSLILGLILVFLPRGIIPKFWVIPCIVPIFFVSAQSKNFELHILDVGQGQAIFLQQYDQNMLIDTGGHYDETKFSLGKQVMLPFLSRQGVNALDQVILTHLDQDHSGAYAAIAARLPVHQLISNEQPTQSSVQFQYCQQGQKWQWQDIHFEVLSPQSQNLNLASQQRNEYSCVIYMQVDKAQPYQSFLFMGDAGWQTEYQILRQYPHLKVDVLVLGHHGSRHSSAYDFLAHYRPSLAIASAGWDNRYGHPSVQVKARLNALNIPLITTIEKGSIRFALNNTHMQLSSMRDQKKWLQRDELD